MTAPRSPAAPAPSSASPATLWLVVNPASGSNSDEATRAVVAALGAAGSPPARVHDIRDGVPGAAELAAGGVGTLAVFTGDGTINAVAAALGTHRAVRCRSLGGAPIALMIDGERCDGLAEERFSLAPFALDLLGSEP